MQHEEFDDLAESATDTARGRAALDLLEKKNPLHTAGASRALIGQGVASLQITIATKEY